MPVHVSVPIGPGVQQPPSPQNGFDPRIVQVGIQIGNDVVYYDGLYITAQGTKFGNQNYATCQVRIENLTREHRDHILTETSLWQAQQSLSQKLLIVNAGRQSYGTFQLFIGNITLAQITQPPDIGIILNAISSFSYSVDTVSVSLPAQTSLKTICETAAKSLGTSLTFQADDKNISNYSFTGSPLQHVGKIAETGNVDACINNNNLIVTNKNVPLIGVSKDVSQQTGMIGVPEINEQGVTVKFLLDSYDLLQGQLNLTSILNPSLNGPYKVYSLSFDISNRDTPFYWIADCVFIR